MGTGVVAAGHKYYNPSECCKRLLTLIRVNVATEWLPVVGLPIIFPSINQQVTLKLGTCTRGWRNQDPEHRVGEGGGSAGGWNFFCYIP